MNISKRILFEEFPKINKGFRTFLRNLRRCFDHIQINLGLFNNGKNMVNLIAHMMSLLSSHVKIPVSCFHSQRNPCNSLKFIDYLLVWPSHYPHPQQSKGCCPLLGQGEGTMLLMWPRFESQSWHHIWVEVACEQASRRALRRPFSALRASLTALRAGGRRFAPLPPAPQEAGSQARVEAVVDSRPYSEGFSLASLAFLCPQKPTF